MPEAKPLPTLKDNDFLNEICKIYIGEEAKSKLLSRLESDVQFLQENNLMDYSLLIGIHEVDRASEAAASSDEAGGTDQDGAVDDRTASAGDGLGSLTSQWHLRRLSTGRRSVDPCVVALAGSQTGDYRSAGDEDDDDEGGVFSDPGVPIPGAIETTAIGAQFRQERANPSGLSAQQQQNLSNITRTAAMVVRRGLNRKFWSRAQCISNAISLLSDSAIGVP
ncbi:hypothetical protein X801_03628 [Opisthorchis viverrini]|uniref:PIPK domain-containing protein n=1 Tax=Opisthorchis viverrini TaxID=6198 RepID=A0A1S8X1A4_OPIVI|nr:hypothetical protein X801_03628 [Opisthorchis viverrini]